MTAWIQFSAHPLVHALGWSLLHFCWQATLVAVVLMCGLGLMRGRSPRLRYAVCCFALLVMVSMALLTFVWLATAAQNGEQVTLGSSSSALPVLNLRGSLDGATEPWLNQITTSLDRALPVVIALWLGGVILFLARLNLGLLVIRRMKFLAAEPVTGELQQLLRDLMRRLQVKRTVRLAKSALVQAPIVIGWLTPVILIPVTCMTGLSVVQVEALIAHELAHIRRHDYLVSVLQSVAEALLFYHPAVWWVSKQIREEREHCCDDLAVAMSGDMLAYAKALASLEERRSREPIFSLGAHGGALTMRIQRLLKRNEDPVISRLATITLTAAVAVAVAVGIAEGTQAQVNAGAQAVIQSNQESAELSGPYRAWLDEDVRWIITPKERLAYLALPDNAERLHFIQEFWKRRNSDPGSMENKFKQEHYRRVAYANVHFGAGKKPGWASDRGRIYIMYGPPDSIDSHPSGGNGITRPFEDWHYRQIREYGMPKREGHGLRTAILTKHDVDMKFVDTCACGNYQLQSPPIP